MKTILIILTLLFLYSCTEDKYPKYQYGISDYMPDSNKVKLADWITKTVQASNFHMTGGDYEDPEDVIEQCQETGEKLFSVQTPGLYYIPCSGCSWEFIPYEKLSDNQLLIFNQLK